MIRVISVTEKDVKIIQAVSGRVEHTINVPNVTNAEIIGEIVEMTDNDGFQMKYDMSSGSIISS